ncbi:MAG: hypothetical protein GY702_12720 [Desulfobulbaceae bacterium]|nr:hypothetical protein [Desulfobulbaceae bacterium]
MKCFYTPLLIVPLFLTSPSCSLTISTNYKITFSMISGEGGYVDLENVITALQLLTVLMPDQVL